jgi:hypothetical protein
MNKKEYLLTCLMEELSEVQQETSKCLRFTPDHLYEPYGTTNLKRLQLEFADVCAVAKLLELEGVNTLIQPPLDPGLEFIDRYFDKMKRTEESYEIARKLGALKDDDSDH